MTDRFRPLKDAFGRFATGVAVATCRAPNGDPVGITINSFTSVSLDPSLVLWCLERNANSFPAFMAATHYGISILRSDQETLCKRLSTPGSPPLSEGEVEEWSGAPVLRDRLAAFDCRVADRHKAGDHYILVGEVVRYESAAGAPLLYFASRFSAGPQAT